MLHGFARLKKQAEFSRVLEAGSKTKFGRLLFFHLPIPGQPPRFGIVISKKVSRLATKRNYLKRLLSHQLKNQSIDRVEGDVVILVLSLPEEAPAEFKQSLERWAKQF